MDRFYYRKFIPKKDFYRIKYFVKESFKVNFKIEEDVTFEDYKNMRKNKEWVKNRPALTVEDRTLKENLL